MTTPEIPRYWFRAKRRGWGWGLPLTWEGWTVLGVWLVLEFAGSVALVRWPAAFVLFSVVMAAVLTAVCWKKGERPRWRW
jgi:hypothetical protein